jgi:exosortase C (VPDSG-CTERM-specific)
MNMETNSSTSSRAPAVAESQRAGSPGGAPGWRRFKALIVFTAVLLLIFSWPLLKLVLFAAHSELYSHILLIPFISGYLVWLKRGQIEWQPGPNRGMAWLPFVIGALVLAAYAVAVRKGWSPEKPDSLAVMTFSFLCFLLGIGLLFAGSKLLRAIAFPVGFLFFSVPFPVALRDGLETFLQRGSTDVAYVFLRMSGMPVLLTGTQFQLPSFSLNVAPECSGIHSSLVLIITSLLAAYLFLKKPLNRWLLVLAVIPLALLRNGFRIFTIAQLCVHIGPQMIDSPIHRRGGPVFFVLSLIPLFLLLVYLGKSELRKEQAKTVPVKE